MSEGSPDPATARVLELLRAHGAHATSFQILEEGFSYWFDPQCEAVVAYVEVSGWWVSASAPVSPSGELGAVSARFVEAARQRRRRVAFFSVDADFIEALKVHRPSLDFDSLAIGEMPEWDPRLYTTEGPQKRSLRYQIRRAQRKGVSVRHLNPEAMAGAPGSLRAQIEVVLNRWLASRHMSAMSFLVDLQPFTFPVERHYYVAEHGDQVVGFLAAIPVYQRQGWFFEDVIRVPDAPNGTVELLIHTAMSEAAARGDAYVTLGLSPLAGLEVGPGRHRVLRRALKFCYDHLGSLYQFQGVYHFKARFRPDRWSKQWLVVVPPPVGVGAFQAVLSAFAGGGVWAFGAETLLRLLRRVPRRWWSRALWGFAILLVPWTVLLAMADGPRWFGDASTQWAWVSFDAVMVLSLSALAVLIGQGSRLGRPLSVFLAGATLTDLLMTTVQVIALHQAAEGWALLFVIAGIVGPLSATIFLAALSMAAPLPWPGARRL